MQGSFLTISVPGRASLRELGSRFLAFAFPLESESDISRHLSALKSEFPDASHHCYAWMMGADGARWRAYDDGEPNHSAGDPILGQIRSAGLSNLLVVVVRYFGGTKLGVSGLIQAYRESARMAIASVPVVEVEVTEEWLILFPYAEMQRVMAAVKAVSANVLQLETDESCRLIIRVGVRHRFSARATEWQQAGFPVQCQNQFQS